MEHAWCSDISRDAAVRAAEDGRDRPLPTLEQCIETAFSAGVRDSFRKVEEAWSMIPKSVSASSPVDQENKGDGMRTERVTLEITHDGKHGPVSTWPFECGSHGKGVRVVEETHFDDLAQVAMERDAAIRERDEARKSWLRSEESGTRLLAQRNAALDDSDALRKRVSELEAASGGVVMNGELFEVPMPCNFQYADDSFFPPNVHGFLRQCVKLKGSPPQPRGWLTGEEREAVQWAADAAYDKQHPAEDTLRNLLARSSPPEVDLPISLSPIDEELIRAALAAAGVAVKEVGRE
jgi:hypothetical protein